MMTTDLSDGVSASGRVGRTPTLGVINDPHERPQTAPTCTIPQSLFLNYLFP